MKNNKLNKIILLTVILSFVFTMAADAVVFTDISNHWAKNYIERVAENGLVSGYENKTFKPDNNVTVLEALVMLSRLYEIDDDLKDEIIEKYEPVLEAMSNTKGYEWSFDYLSVIIELGVVSENGMKDMFSKKTVFNDATREEIAVLLTKAMMLDGELKKAFVLPFNDADKISEVAKQYVYMMYDKEIMQGDNKKNFNPTNKITRAEIATVLDKAYDYIEENEVYPEFEGYATNMAEGIITELSKETSEQYIYVKGSDEVENVVKINNETKIYINSKEKKFSDLKEDMLVECRVDDSGYAVKIQADSNKEVIKGTIYYVAYSDPMAITIYDDDKDKIKYNVSSDTDVYLDGKKTEFRKLNEDDEVMLILDGKKLLQISSVSKTKYFEGEITSINYASYPIEISIKTKEGVVKTFEFNSDVEVIRNDEKSSFDRVRAGDEGTITTEYNKMVKISTTAKEAEMSGIIKEIIIGPVNKIKVEDKNGDTEQYDVNSNAVITIGNKNALISDLRVGFNVNINTSGGEIVSIDASELSTVINFTGKVVFINKDEKLIKMQNTGSGTGNSIVDLKVTNSTKIMNLSGETRYFKDIAEGQSIYSTAVSQGLEYVAVIIMIQ